jgi:type II secretory pathway component PulK
MQIRRAKPNRGIALIIVMIVITFFSILVAGFSYSMKVETRLARNSGFDSEMDWLGRSGIELAKYVLGQQPAVRATPTACSRMCGWTTWSLAAAPCPSKSPIASAS